MLVRDRVSLGVLPLTLFMFFLALAVNATPVADLDGIAHQSTMVVTGPERTGMFAAGTPHGPIAIDGDADFAATALAEGWPGDGSPENPYIIDNLDIDLMGGAGHCLSISNTRVNFTISNCQLIGASAGGGIYLNNVTYGKLIENTFDSNKYGSNLERSSFNTLANNTCTSNTVGMYLHYSDSNTVANNTCSFSTDDGINLDISHYNTLANNTCSSNNGNGIYIGPYGSNTLVNNTCSSNNESGISLYHTYDNIISNNTCASNIYSGISVYDSYSNIMSGNTCTGNDFAGIGIGDSPYTTIVNNTCSSNSYGIYINDYFFDWYTDNTVVNNTCTSNTEVGIYLDGTNSDTISSNNCTSNTYGIYLNYADSNTVANNTCTSNTDYGIYLVYSEANLVFNNTCNGNYFGIRIFYSNSNSLAHNTCNSNSFGIRAYYSDFNTVANNTCTSNKYDSIYLDYSNHNTVTNNICTSNGVGCTLIFSNSNTVASNNCSKNTGDGIRVSYSNSNTVADNTCYKNNIGIRIRNSNSNAVANNTCTSNTVGIRIYSSNSNAMTNNTCSSSIVGIRIYSSNSNTVANNTCSSNTYGIYLYYADSNTVANNTCTSNNVGIYLYYSNFNTMSDNTCPGNTWGGIMLEFSNSNIVVNNTCTSNTVGIYLYYSDSTIITDNIWSYNLYGIYLESWCRFNTVTNNTCTDNTYGIYLDSNSVYDNNIHWNVFADNSFNGMDTKGLSAFSYNFWSDYTGIDANGDGIGDTAHELYANSDPYPLAYQPILRWIELPKDQSVEFEDLFRYQLPILYYGPLICSISDSTRFSIDSQGVVESNGILAIGDYDLRVDVTNIYGSSITATFCVRVSVDANNQPGWLTIPIDQSIAFGEKFEYQVIAIDPSGIDYWTLNDTTHFTLSVSFFNDGSTARITNNSVLEPGFYGLNITVYDIYGNALSAVFEVVVTPREQDPPFVQRLDLKLSGSFDFLLNEDIHLQLVALLTYLDTGEPISGAAVTFYIYDPDGVILVSGTLVEDQVDSGVYIYIMPDTMKDLKLAKGLYLVYAVATLPDGAQAVDMIQFHIDPPGEDDAAFKADLNVPLLLTNVIVLGGFATVGLLVAVRRRIGRIEH